MKSRSTASQDASPARRNAPRRAPPARPLPPAPGNDAKKRSTHRRSGEIIEAAAQVFAERGYHGATTQDIADVLNIRQASLYYYFPSKEVALELVCMRGVEAIFEGVLKDGQRSGEFRSDIDTRLATLSILSVVNGCAAWYEREQISIERIGSEFIRFVLGGIDRPAPARDAKSRPSQRSR